VIFLPYIFIFITAIFWALADTVENENFFASIFKNLDQKFWYKRESWKHAKKTFGWKFDSWHISKSLVVIFFLLAAAFKTNHIEQILKTFTDYYFIVGKLLFVIISGTIFNFTSNLFYNYIFKRS